MAAFCRRRFLSLDDEIFRGRQIHECPGWHSFCNASRFVHFCRLFVNGQVRVWGGTPCGITVARTSDSSLFGLFVGRFVFQFVAKIVDLPCNRALASIFLCLIRYDSNVCFFLVGHSATESSGRSDVHSINKELFLERQVILHYSHVTLNLRTYRWFSICR